MVSSWLLITTQSEGLELHINNWHSKWFMRVDSFNDRGVRCVICLKDRTPYRNPVPLPYLCALDHFSWSKGLNLFRRMQDSLGYTSLSINKYIQDSFQRPWNVSISNLETHRVHFKSVFTHKEWNLSSKGLRFEGSVEARLSDQLKGRV